MIFSNRSVAYRRRRTVGGHVVAAAVLAMCLGAVLVGCHPSPDELSSADVPLLTVGAPADPDTPTYDPMFNQITLSGQTYTLPFPVRELIDAGWVLDDDGRMVGESGALDISGGSATGLDGEDIVPQNGAVTAQLVPGGGEAGDGIAVTIMNVGPDSVALGDAEVWSVAVEGTDQEPYAGIREGMPVDNVADVLGAVGRTESNGFTSVRDMLSPEQIADLSTRPGIWPGAATSAATLYVEAADGVVGPIGAADGWYYLVWVPAAQMDHMTTVASDMPARSGTRRQCHGSRYTWHMPEDLAPRAAGDTHVWETGWGLVHRSIGDSDGFVDTAAIYSVDGKRYAIAATGTPDCEEVVADSGRARDQTLFRELRDRDGTAADMVSRVPERWLLWDRDDSSAAVLVYRGTGASGAETMQVVVNYGDWEHRSRMTFLYSLVALDDGGTITDGVANLLLAVASDATTSLSWEAR